MSLARIITCRDWGDIDPLLIEDLDSVLLVVYTLTTLGFPQREEKWDNMKDKWTQKKVKGMMYFSS